MGSGRGLQDDVFADLVGAAPGQHLALAIMIGEGMQPEGVVVVGAAQDAGDALFLRSIGQRQPILVIDPGRVTSIIDLNVPSGHVQSLNARPLAHTGRHDVVAAAGDGQSHLLQRAVIEPPQVLVHQALDVAAEPHGVATAGQVLAQWPALHVFYGKSGPTVSSLPRLFLRASLTMAPLNFRGNH